MKIENEKKFKFSKSLLLNCIYLIIGICILYNIVFLINTTILENNYLHLFGISLFNMKNDLMQGDINKNDLVIVKQEMKEELQEGDIIAYTVNGNIRINKIINKQQEYVTKSNKNYHPDIEKVTTDQIIGKKVIKIPFLGILIEILQSKMTSIFVFIFLVFCFCYNRYMYTKKKERYLKKRNFTNTKINSKRY